MKHKNAQHSFVLRPNRSWRIENTYVEFEKNLFPASEGRRENQKNRKSKKSSASNEDSAGNNASNDIEKVHIVCSFCFTSNVTIKFIRGKDFRFRDSAKKTGEKNSGIGEIRGILPFLGSLEATCEIFEYDYYVGQGRGGGLFVDRIFSSFFKVCSLGGEDLLIKFSVGGEDLPEVPGLFS